MKKITAMTVFTILLVLITAFCISGTVHSQDKGRGDDKAQYDHMVRQNYVETLRSFLEEKGYGNSGVTMNYVINEDDTVEYMVTIHHRKIDKLEEKERSLLADECKDLASPAECSDLSITFI